MSQMYEVTVTATGEVRDSEGNLIDTVPIESTMQVSEEQARELGLLNEEEAQ